MERRIPPDHPLRATRKLTDAALAGLSRDFDKLYARDDRPSIPPSKSCGRCCCRRSTRCARNGNCWSSFDYNLLFAKFVAGVLNLPQVNHAVRDRSALAESSNVIFRPGESKWTLKCVTERY